MGFYIEAPEGQHKQKAEYFHNHHGAELILSPKFPTDGSVLVCVVDNGPFEAAGICYSREEFAVFNHPDSRPKTWLKFSREVIEKLCPQVVPHLQTK